jgi:hypothetical protein
MLKQDRYVELRLNGMRDRQAARGAGFAGGVSSRAARRLFEAILMIEDEPDFETWLVESKQIHETKIAQHAAALTKLRELQRAMELHRRILDGE